MIAIVFPKWEVILIDPIGEVGSFGEMAGADSRHGNEGHHGPVAHKQRDAGNNEAAQPECAEQNRGEEITEGDALQDAHQPHLLDSPGDPARVDDAQGEDQHSANDDSVEGRFFALLRDRSRE